jgi:hypothetical protein
MAIVKAEYKSPKGYINSRLELHGACRHVPVGFNGLSLKTPTSDDYDERKKRETVALYSPSRLTRRPLNPHLQTLDLDGESRSRANHSFTPRSGRFSIHASIWSVFGAWRSLLYHTARSTKYDFGNPAKKNLSTVSRVSLSTKSTQ